MPYLLRVYVSLFEFKFGIIFIASDSVGSNIAETVFF